MAFKKWIVNNPNVTLAKSLAEECDVDAFTALVAVSRGIENAAELEQLLDAEPQLADPNELIDIQNAAKIINTAINDNKKLAVFGDYDCDGVVATAIMYDYLKGRGADVTVYIPDREAEGYGMNKSAIKSLSEQGVELIITVDNGISCFEEIEYASTLGIQTIVTDHHIPPEILPNAAAVVDPHRIDCPSSFKEICGAEVAFKLVCVLDDKEPEQLLWQYADLLAIATVGDVMPLTNENRSIVREGIKRIKAKPRVGVSAILSSAAIEKNSINAQKISFGIVPRLNAAGRMGDAKRAFNLLIETDMLKALGIANTLDSENAERQLIERKITEEAVKIIELNGYHRDRVIVVEGESWKTGVVGIVASRISEKYSKPAIVLSVSEGMAHGSGRSFSGFNLYNSISFSADYLSKFGGHELAAGVSLKEENIPAFRKAINEYAYKSELCLPNLNIDFKLNPAGMTVDMAFALKGLEPFGAGNPIPVFGIFGVTLERITPLSNGKHLKLLLSKGGSQFQALMFGVTEQQFCFSIGDKLDLAVTLDANLFKDQYSLSIAVKGVRPADVIEEKLFADLDNIDRFFSNTSFNKELILPEREEAVNVYKYIAANPSGIEKIKYAFINTLGVAKTEVALMAFRELGLIAENGGVYYRVPLAEKTDLNSSAVFKKIKGEG